MSQKRGSERQGPGTKRNRGEHESLREAIPVPGSIMKIELQNFMCHTFFEVELSSTVNFIVGRNGSGKSAILMALVIGLGGKSSATNRAPNMTEFIKQGSSWGQVTISICNSDRNHDAWEFDTYGDFVAVERRITKNGSSYKLKSSAGKTISTKKNDLTLLLDHYNIQVNNPVSILNQEMAKKFLASTDPSSKYNFFMKSTHLEQMILDYQQVNEKLEMIRHTVAKKERSVPDIKAQVKHLQNQYNEITELRDMGKKVSLLKDELIWSKVKEIEDQLIPIERSIETFKSHLPKVDSKISRATEEYNEEEKNVKIIENEMSEDMKKYTSLESDQASLKQLSLAKKREVLDLQRKGRSLQAKINELDGDRGRLADRIKEIEESNTARNIEAEQEARERELTGCKSKHEEYTRDMTSTTATMEELDKKIGALNEEVSRVREDVEASDAQMKKEQITLKNYQQAKSTRVSVFGDFMPDLLRRIEEAHVQGRFHMKPRGPFGLHLKVKDAKWAKVIELALGALVFNFVVHDQHDKTVLQELFRKSISNSSQYPNMIMMKFKETFYNVTAQKPQTGHPTMYDMVEIDDHVISNALVEQARIEQSLLIESSEEARKLIIGHAPRHVFNAWTLAGDDVRERASYSNNASRYNKGYFRDDPSQVIEEINLKIRTLREQSATQRQHGQRIDQEVKGLRKEYGSEKNKQQSIKKKLEGIRSRMIELDNVEEAPLLDATALEDEMKQYGAQVTDLRAEVDGLGDKEKQLREEQEDATRRLNESIERDSHITNRLEELKSKMHEGQKLVTTKHGILDKLKKKKKEVNSEVKKFTQECNAKKREIQDAHGMAEQRCERVDTRRSARDLEQQIRNMELRIQQGSSTTASVDDITRRFQEAKKKYEEIQGMVSQMKKFSRELQQILEEREEKYFLFRKEISKRINYFFIMNLSQRGYTGQLKVDHETSELRMQLNVDTSGASHDTHDVRSLSGGERSFSTVCFICSLWNLMESPFRCLDEFDVFMDLYNRRITMNLLMEHAFQNNTPRQYIFFTPQDMSATSKKHKNIKILQLAAPERNNEEDG